MHLRIYVNTFASKMHLLSFEKLYAFCNCKRKPKWLFNGKRLMPNSKTENDVLTVINVNLEFCLSYCVLQVTLSLCKWHLLYELTLLIVFRNLCYAYWYTYLIICTLICGRDYINSGSRLCISEGVSPTSNKTKLMDLITYDKLFL